MEAVNNVATSAQSAATSAYNAASQLIFGEDKTTESGSEPVSGEQGQGSKDSPFDQGNKDAAAPPSGTQPAQQQDSGREPLSGAQGAGTLKEPFDQGNKQDGAAASRGTTDTSSVPSSSAAGGAVATTSPVGETGSSTLTQKELDVNKSMGVSQGGQQDTVKQPKDTGEEAMLTRVQGDHSGEPMGMHDKSGSAAEIPAGSNDLSGEALKAKGAASEKRVRSTGLAADGGDFDATRPGAGAEASRLMKKKSVDDDHETVQTSMNTGGETGVDDAKAKPKLSEKIKEKLHIHRH